MLSSGKVLPTKIHPPLLRPMAYRVLSKKYGLSIKSDGLAALSEFIGTTFGTTWKQSSETIKFLELFASVWKQQERGLFVDRVGVEDVINELKEREKTVVKETHTASTEKKMRPKTVSKTIDNFLVRNVKDEAEQEQEEEEGPLDQSLDAIEDDTHNEHTQIEEPMPLAQEMDIDQQQEQERDEQDLDWRDYFKIINSSEQRKFSYNPLKRQLFYQPNKSIHPELLHIPSPQAKIDLFRTRYFLTRDRLLRNENFQNSNDTFNPLSSMIQMKNSIQNGQSDQITSGLSITQIKNLLGRDSQNFLLLGMLKKTSKGTWSLEDVSGSVEIDISQTIPSPGLYFIPGSIVLVEGIYYTVGHKFAVTSMTYPPGERRDKTLDSIGNLDLLGIHGNCKTSYVPRLDNEIKIRLHLLERELIDHKFVLLGGDMFLDELQTMEALKKVLQRIDSDPPTVLLFFGSFSSTPVHASMSSKNISSTTQYKNNFDSLADLLSQFENIINYTHLVFIPGPNDPWTSISSLGANGILPQKPIPTFFTKKMNRVCKHITWGSNPTRIAYLSQEIVIYRDNTIELFKRHQVVFPVIEQERENELLELEEQMANTSIDDTTMLVDRIISEKEQLPAKVVETRKIIKTLLDQGHLSPFVDSIRPVAWDMDHTLTLHPIPSSLILSDMSTAPFDLTYNGCKSINPGKFIHKRRARYMEFQPSLKTVSQEEIYF